MARRREFSFDLGASTRDGEVTLEPTLPPHIPVGTGEWRPETEYEALMQAPPGHEPAVSRGERRELREVLVDAIDSLSQEDRHIFDGWFIRRVSFRQLSIELGPSKSTIARRRDRIVQELQTKLEDDEEIRSYLKGGRR